MKIKLVCIGLLFSVTIASAQKVALVDRNWVRQMSQNNSDTTYVINFWATWCKPCVEEIGYFDQITEQYKGQKLKVILVSCDFKKQLETRVIPFVQSKKIQSAVYLMNETDPNNWIELVDSKFTGAIPATLIVNGKQDFRFFKEGEITFEELQSVIQSIK